MSYDLIKKANEIKRTIRDQKLINLNVVKSQSVPSFGGHLNAIFEIGTQYSTNNGIQMSVPCGLKILAKRLFMVLKVDLVYIK